jgi:hypothetical protein
MFQAADGVARRRGLVIIISDFIGVGDWSRALARLALRHEVVVLRIVDSSDEGLPQAGELTVEDAETGEQFTIDSSDPRVQARIRELVLERESEVVAGLRRAGVADHRISTEDDLADALVRVISATQWRRS